LRKFELRDKRRSQWLQFRRPRRLTKNRSRQGVNSLRRDCLKDLHVTRNPVRIAQAIRMRELSRENGFEKTERHYPPNPRPGHQAAKSCECRRLTLPLFDNRFFMLWFLIRRLFIGRLRRGDAVESVAFRHLKNLAIGTCSELSQWTNPIPNALIPITLFAAKNFSEHWTGLRFGGPAIQAWQHLIQIIGTRPRFEFVLWLHHQHVHAMKPLCAEAQRRCGLPPDADHQRRKRSEHAAHGVHAVTWKTI
jgi:hypothetical protein